MKQYANTFLMQFAAAYKANHHYMVTRRTTKAILIAAALQRLGLIRHTQIVPIYGPRDKKNVIKASFIHFDDYMIVWLKKSPTTVVKHSQTQSLPKYNMFAKNITPCTKLEIRIKPSHKDATRVSYKQLYDRIHGYSNKIYIMETPRGIITSEEALNLKVGGFIICTIHL